MRAFYARVMLARTCDRNSKSTGPSSAARRYGFFLARPRFAASRAHTAASNKLRIQSRIYEKSSSTRAADAGKLQDAAQRVQVGLAHRHAAFARPVHDFRAHRRGLQTVAGWLARCDCSRTRARSNHFSCNHMMMGAGRQRHPAWRTRSPSRQGAASLLHGSAIVINNATIVHPDIRATNGVIHAIDARAGAAQSHPRRGGVERRAHFEKPPAGGRAQA